MVSLKSRLSACPLSDVEAWEDYGRRDYKGGDHSGTSSRESVIPAGVSKEDRMERAQSIWDIEVRPEDSFDEDPGIEAYFAGFFRLHWLLASRSVRLHHHRCRYSLAVWILRLQGMRAMGMPMAPIIRTTTSRSDPSP